MIFDTVKAILIRNDFTYKTPLPMIKQEQSSPANTERGAGTQFKYAFYLQNPSRDDIATHLWHYGSRSQDKEHELEIHRHS